MLHKVVDTEQADVAREQANWLAANAEAMELGFAWVAALLHGGDGANETRGAYQAARTRLAEAGEPAAIDRFGSIFGLASFDLDVLLLGCTAQYIGGVGAPDQNLALSLFASTPAEARALARSRFGADAPLRRFRLIGFNDSNPTGKSTFELDERIARLLFGEDQRVPEIEQALADRNYGPVSARDVELIDKLAAAVEVTCPAAALIGPRRSGRRAAAAALAQRFGLGLRTLRSRVLPADAAGRREFIAVLGREAALGRFAVLVDADEAEGKLAAEDLLHAFAGFTIVVAAGHLETPRPVPAARCLALTSADRLSLWRQALGRRADQLGPQIEDLAEHFALGPEEIARLAANSTLDGETLWAACREIAGGGLAGLSERIVPRFTYEDIVLPDEVTALLRAIEAQVRYKSRVLGRGGFGESLVRGRGTTALFAGASGVGKTMAAEVLANSLGLDLHRIDLSSVVSKYIGETERNLRQVFDAAEAGGCVLFFDEADALFGKRTEVKDSHDRYANVEISYLLQRMEAFSGLAILATNLKNNLDPAFTRRLRYVVDIPYPDAVHRETMWRRAFPAGTEIQTLDYAALSRLDLAGGNIAVVAINAAYLAAAAGGAVTMKEIEQAARAEFKKLDRDFRGWR